MLNLAGSKISRQKFGNRHSEVGVELRVGFGDPRSLAKQVLGGHVNLEVELSFSFPCP